MKTLKTEDGDEWEMQKDGTVLLEAECDECGHYLTLTHADLVAMLEEMGRGVTI